MFDLDSLFIRWLRPVEPIYRREAERGRTSCLLGCWWGIATVVALGLCGSVIGGGLFLPFTLFLPLVSWIWRLQVTLSASDTMTYEVQGRTWETLRALPWSTTEIVKSKYAGVLIRARLLFFRYLALRIFSVLCGLTIGMLLWYHLRQMQLMTDGQAPDTDWSALAAIATSLLYLLVEPLLDFTTDAALGLMASAFARTPSAALALGLASSVMIQVGQILVSILVISALAPTPFLTSLDVVTTGWQLATWGVGGVLLLVAEPDKIVLLLFLALTLRYALLRGLLALAAWRAAAI